MGCLSLAGRRRTKIQCGAPEGELSLHETSDTSAHPSFVPERSNKGDASLLEIETSCTTKPSQLPCVKVAQLRSKIEDVEVQQPEEFLADAATGDAKVTLSSRVELGNVHRSEERLAASVGLDARVALGPPRASNAFVDHCKSQELVAAAQLDQAWQGLVNQVAETDAPPRLHEAVRARNIIECITALVKLQEDGARMPAEVHAFAMLVSKAEEVWLMRKSMLEVSHTSDSKSIAYWIEEASNSGTDMSIEKAYLACLSTDQTDSGDNLKSTSSSSQCNGDNQCNGDTSPPRDAAEEIRQDSSCIANNSAKQAPTCNRKVRPQSAPVHRGEQSNGASCFEPVKCEDDVRTMIAERASSKRQVRQNVSPLAAATAADTLSTSSSPYSEGSTSKPRCFSYRTREAVVEEAIKAQASRAPTPAPLPMQSPLTPSNLPPLSQDCTKANINSLYRLPSRRQLSEISVGEHGSPPPPPPVSNSTVSPSPPAAPPPEMDDNTWWRPSWWPSKAKTVLKPTSSEAEAAQVSTNRDQPMEPPHEKQPLGREKPLPKKHQEEERQPSKGTKDLLRGRLASEDQKLGDGSKQENCREESGKVESLPPRPTSYRMSNCGRMPTDRPPPQSASGSPETADTSMPTRPRMPWSRSGASRFDHSSGSASFHKSAARSPLRSAPFKTPMHAQHVPGFPPSEPSMRQSRRPTSAPAMRGALQSPRRAANLGALGFSPGAIPSEIELKRALKDMAMQWHPDRPHNRKNPGEATEKFQAGKQAYDSLLLELRLMGRR